MIGEYDLWDIARRAARHMARNTVVAVGEPDFGSRAAILRLMAGEAFAPEIRRLLAGLGRCVGIVAGSAPHFVTAPPLAGALGQVFHVAGHSHLGGRTGAYEQREIIRQ